MSVSRKKNVLVTGGAGFIGSHVVERLLATERYSVVVVDDFDDFYDPELKRWNLSHLVRSPDLSVVECDILDSGVLASLFASEGFEAIVHLAARTGVRHSLREPLLYHRVNVEGTLGLLELARRYHIPRFVFGSSSSVYGSRRDVPFRESDPTDRPVSPYAASKLAAEGYCHTYSHLFGIDVRILRLFTVYGPRQRPDLAIWRFTDRIAKNRPIPIYGDGNTVRDYTYVGDVANALVRAVEVDGPAYDILNVGAQNPLRLIDLVVLISGALGLHPKIEWLPEQPGDVPITHADISKARDVLGFKPEVNIYDGIRKYIAWYCRERRGVGSPCVDDGSSNDLQPTSKAAGRG